MFQQGNDFPLLDRLTSSSDVLYVFFFALWKKSNGPKSTNHVLQDINIPDTIILHHSRPLHWFFSSNIDGTVKAKNRKNLTTDNILLSWTKKNKSSPHCCSQQILLDEREERGYHMKYVTAKDLPSLISDGSSGLLQTFVTPKNERGQANNYEVIGNWTPNVFFAEKLINHTNYENEKIPLADRCTTKDTSRFVQTVPLVSQMTTRVLENIGSAVATHIEVVFRVRVLNLVLHFKIDADDRPVLLFCSGMRLADAGVKVTRCVTCYVAGELHQNNQSPSSLPRITRRSPGDTRHAASPAENKGRKCALCRRMYPKDYDMLEVPRKHVLFPLSVLHFYSTHPPNAVFQDLWTPGEEVPAHVLLLCPELPSDTYKEYRDNLEWENEPIHLCTPCSSGIHLLTSNISIRSDGCIQFPFGRGQGAPAFKDVVDTLQHIEGDDDHVATPRVMAAFSPKPATIGMRRQQYEKGRKELRKQVAPSPSPNKETK